MMVEIHWDLEKAPGRRGFAALSPALDQMAGTRDLEEKEEGLAEEVVVFSSS